MKLKHRLLIVCTTLFSLAGSAQAIDNTLSYKNISNDRYIRFNYENDFFGATDKYYTQGLHLEVVAPWVKKFPLSELLVHPRFGYIRYGIALEQEGYTNSHIERSDIIYGDRPFCADFFLKTFLIAIDSVNKQRFSTTLSTGVIGPAAFGDEMQTGIHKALNNITPHGWHNQIRNDAVINYQVDYEHQLVAAGKVFMLDAGAMGRVGTLSDKAGAGITVMFGYFNSPYSSTIVTGNNFRIYAYEHPFVNVVGYDATLQGGIANKTSPYTISAGDISRVTLENRFGFVLTYRRVYLEYFQSYLSQEFKTGDYHVWGGVQLAVGL